MCGCSGKSNLKSSSRPAMLPRQTTIRATSAPQTVQSQSTTNNGLTADQRSVEKKRREVLFRKLGRI